MVDNRNQGFNLNEQKLVKIKDGIPEYMWDDCDYVMLAEKVMNNIYEYKKISEKDKKKNRKNWNGYTHVKRESNSFGNLTTSKIRNVLSLLNDIYNTAVTEKDVLSDNTVNRIRYMKVRLVYEAGREEDIKDFVERAELLNGLNCIGKDPKKFDRYVRYFEALVAYRKYLAKDDLI